MRVMPVFAVKSFPTVASALLVAITTPAAAQRVTLLAGGDIGWVRTVKAPVSFSYQSPVEASITVYEGTGEQAVQGETANRQWTSVPFLNRPEMRDSIAIRIGRDLYEPGAPHLTAITFPLEFRSLEEEVRYPFQRLRDLIRSADVAFGNLEMALEADQRFHTGEFVGHPLFAEALRWAGFDVISTANDHSLDGELPGLMSTIEALRRAGIGHLGSGRDLEEARKPHIIEVNGISIAFLGYTQRVAHGGSWSFANEGRPGAMPMDPLLIKEDIRRVRDQVDFVAVSLHWGIENTHDTHPDARAFAHEIIDAGGDIILGHRSNLPQGVETYNGGVILYSPGNLVFGHNRTYWADNYLARFTLSLDRITQVEVIPIAGQGNDLAQPYPMQITAAAPVVQGPGGGRGGGGSGSEVATAQVDSFRVASLLRRVQQLSERLGTTMEIVDGVGIVRP